MRKRVVNCSIGRAAASALVLAFLVFPLSATQAAPSQSQTGFTAQDRENGTKRMRWSMSLITVQMVARRAGLLWLVLSGCGRRWHDWFLRGKEGDLQRSLLHALMPLAVAAVRIWLHQTRQTDRSAEKIVNDHKGTLQMAICDFLYFSAVLAFIALVETPFALGRYRVQRVFGLGIENPFQWVREVGGYALMVVAVMSGLSLVLYLIMRRYPRRWPILVLIVITPLSLVWTLSSPLMGSALGGTTVRGPLQTKLLRVGRLCGIGDSFEIVVEDTPAIGAHFEGLTRKRAVLTTALVKRLTPDELAFVVAHEMMHDRLHHLWHDVVVGTIGTIAGFVLILSGLRHIVARWGSQIGVEHERHSAGYPIILFLASMLVLADAPLENARGRWMERQADLVALDRCAPQETNHRAAIRALEKIGAGTLTDPDPPWLFHHLFFNHPSLDERVRAISETSHTSHTPHTSPSGP